MQKIQFDYFTGMEAEQYSFYRVPKVLFTEPCFKTLSCEAKVLYGLIRKLAAYVILGINTDGRKEVLSINVGDNERGFCLTLRNLL